MYCVKNIKDDIFWVGGNDRRLALFENVFPIPARRFLQRLSSLLDEKTVLLDTVDKAVSGMFFENLEHVLGGRKLDYVDRATTWSPTTPPPWASSCCAIPR